MKFTLMYRSPLGFRSRSYEAATYEGGKAEAARYCDHPCVEMISLRVEREPASEAADQRGDEPANESGEQLSPYVASSGEDYELLGHGESGLAPDAIGEVAGAELLDQWVVRDVHFLLGDGDEMKVHKLLNHHLLISGPSEVYTAKSPLKVSDLLCMLANLQVVDEQVQRYVAHGGSPHETDMCQA